MYLIFIRAARIRRKIRKELKENPRYLDDVYGKWKLKFTPLQLAALFSINNIFSACIACGIIRYNAEEDTISWDEELNSLCNYLYQMLASCKRTDDNIVKINDVYSHLMKRRDYKILNDKLCSSITNGLDISKDEFKKLMKDKDILYYGCRIYFNNERPSLNEWLSGGFNPYYIFALTYGNSLKRHSGHDGFDKFISQDYTSWNISRNALEPDNT